MSRPPSPSVLGVHPDKTIRMHQAPTKAADPARDPRPLCIPSLGHHITPSPTTHQMTEMSSQMTIDQEVPEMTLSTLLDADAFTGALGGDVPCQQEDPELWFAETPDDIEFAKALCGMCPAREACLRGALSRREPWGVWGGQLFLNGSVLAHKRPRGRPRKDAAAVEAATVALATAAAERVLEVRAS